VFVRVEPSSCRERKGLVQIRFCMYLDEGDYGYDVHHVQVPVIPEEGYTGKVNEFGTPVDMKHYQKWLNRLPKVWQTNPFHNHFIYVEPDTSDEEIMNIGQAFLEESFIKWASNEKLDFRNPLARFYTNPDSDRLKAVDGKVKHLKETILEINIGSY